jgi:hypothetical protein
MLQQAAAIAQLQQQLKQQLQQQQKQQQQQQQVVSVGATAVTPTSQRVISTMSILGQGQTQPRVMARGKLDVSMYLPTWAGQLSAYWLGWMVRPWRQQASLKHMWQCTRLYSSSHCCDNLKSYVSSVGLDAGMEIGVDTCSSRVISLIAELLVVPQNVEIILPKSDTCRNNFLNLYCNNVVTCMSDCRWGFDWWLDLLTTYGS